jgi:hypothetical protein
MGIGVLVGAAVGAGVAAGAQAAKASIATRANNIKRFISFLLIPSKIWIDFVDDQSIRFCINLVKYYLDFV